jgi:hypothetical protein
MKMKISKRGTRKKGREKNRKKPISSLYENENLKKGDEKNQHLIPVQI